jgi:hypothetical protein
LLHFLHGRGSSRDPSCDARQQNFTLSEEDFSRQTRKILTAGGRASRATVAYNGTSMAERASCAAARDWPSAVHRQFRCVEVSKISRSTANPKDTMRKLRLWLRQCRVTGSDRRLKPVIASVSVGSIVPYLPPNQAAIAPSIRATAPQKAPREAALAALSAVWVACAFA